MRVDGQVWNILSRTDAENLIGHERSFAPQKNSDPFRRRAAVKYVTDLRLGRGIVPRNAAGMIPSGTGQMAIRLLKSMLGEATSVADYL
jgi:hypothetical protein